MDELLGKLWQWRWAIAISALTLAVGVGVAAIYSPSFVVGATLAVSVLGLAANLAMAIGALAVVVTWRKQIQGTSQHDVAKRVAMELQDLLTNGTALLIHWYNWRNADEADKRVFNERILRSLSELQLVIARMKRLTIEVRAIWGQLIASPLESFVGGDCVGLLVDVQTELNGDHQHPALRATRDELYDGAKPDGLWHQRFKEWIRFIDDWTMPYVGRGSVEPMTMEEFERRLAELSRPVIRPLRPSPEQSPPEPSPPTEGSPNAAQASQATPPLSANTPPNEASIAANDEPAKT